MCANTTTNQLGHKFRAQGVDVYFDNVGGEVHLISDHLSPHAALGNILDLALALLARGGAFQPIVSAPTTDMFHGMTGRVVVCGAISQYNTPSGNGGRVQGPSNYLSLLVNRGRMEGFVVFDYAKQYNQALQEVKATVALP